MLGMCLLALLGVSACRAWYREDIVLRSAVPERKPLQVFVDGDGTVVHGVVVTDSMVSAVPRHRDPQCDSCRVAWARDRVDSVRVRRTSTTRTLLLGAGIAAFIFIPNWPERSS